MKPVRIIVLAVAAVAAIGLALVVRNVLGGASSRPATAAVPVAQPVEKPMARVLVAKRDLKVGERLTANDIDWQPWPLDAVNQAFVTDGSVPGSTPAAEAAPEGSAAPEKAAERTTEAAGQVSRAVDRVTGGGPKAAFVGAVVREPFLAGEPIVDRKLVRAGESGYMAVVLQPGMRAMAISVTVESGAGGFILPGDRVDVLLSAKVDNETEGGSRRGFAAATVLRNVRILAIDQQTSADKGENAVVGATATIEVGPREAEALALAKAQGDLSLALRSYADVGEPSGLGDPIRSASSGGGASGVRVFRGGEQPGS